MLSVSSFVDVVDLVPRRAVSRFTDKRLMSQVYVRIYLCSRAASVVTLKASNVWREMP